MRILNEKCLKAQIKGSNTCNNIIKHFSNFLCKGNICSTHVICKVVSQHGKVMITNNSNTDSHVLWFKSYIVDEVHIIIVNTVESNVEDDWL